MVEFKFPLEFLKDELEKKDPEGKDPKIQKTLEDIRATIKKGTEEATQEFLEFIGKT